MIQEAKPEIGYALGPKLIEVDRCLHGEYEFPRFKDSRDIVCWIDSAGRHVYYLQNAYRQLRGVAKGFTLYLVPGWNDARRYGPELMEFLDARQAFTIELI